MRRWHMINYITSKNELYKGNPLIEALPPVLEDIDVIERLCYYPIYSQSDRRMDVEDKVMRIKQLYYFYQAFDIHIKLYKDIDFMIREAYVPRNPMKHKDFNEQIYNNYERIQGKENVKRVKRNMGIGKCLVGTAGIGKTSAINKVLELFPQVLIHDEYQGELFRYTQITFVSILAPFDGSLKALLLNVLAAIDDVVGTSYCDRAIRSKVTINSLIAQVEQIFNVYHVGLLVIDEFQFLNKKGDQVLNFLTSILNTWGISLYLIGTPPTLNIIQQDLRVARRFQLLKYEHMNKDSKEWNYLLNDLWQYQYTVQITELTQELSDCFYQYSQGVTDMLIKLFIEVQIKAVEQNKKITVSLIRAVAKENMSMVQPMVMAMGSGDKYQLNQYQDIMI